MDPVTETDETRTRDPRPNPLGRAHLARPSLSRVTAQSGAGAGRRLQVAVAVVAAIGVGVAYGYGVSPAADAPAASASLVSTAVHSANVVCPELTGSNNTVNAYSPDLGTTPAAADTATVTQLGAKTPLATLKKTGTLSVNTNVSGNVASLSQFSIPAIGQATGAYAPGFTVTETLSSGVGTAHGLASTACTAPDTDLWYLGADPNTNSGAAELNLYNGDQIATQLNIAGYTATGQVNTQLVQKSDQGVLVLAGTQYDHPIELTDFSGDGTPIAVHVSTTVGRISAALLDSDGTAGRDFIQAQKPASSLVIPGVPSTKAKLQLYLFSPNADTDVSLHWIGAGKIVPTVNAPHLTAGKVAKPLDITNVPAAGEAGALEIDSSNNTPILAEIKVTAQGSADTAYLSPVPALVGESIVADDNGGSVVELTNNGAKDAQVKVTVEGTGTPTPQTVTVPAGTTKAVTVAALKGATSFAISVDPGGAPGIYAARVMTNGNQLTIQPMSTALETVQIPAVRDDLSGTVPQNQ
jgi:hypothetical protein